ncbi:sentrin-specific protease 2 [Ornithorhynchus anatinus]|uniref:SUMO specific peptidase 2 n=1 Tax=Ornithorhynchus anatinus TaxID=9258 RepID=F6RNI9_ORNAN|nr:sentrin-specific protease 2 [Ornithorhynchus anatinus]
MYHWLLHALRALFGTPRRHARLPPRKRTLPRTERIRSSISDSDEIQAKRPKLDYFIGQVKKTVWDVANLIRSSPSQSKCLATSVCNGTQSGNSDEKVFPNSSNSSSNGPGRQMDPRPWSDTQKLDKKTPNGASNCTDKMFQDSRSARFVPLLSFPLNQGACNPSSNGSRHNRYLPASFLPWKRPIRECGTSEPYSSETGKTLRRPHYTVEEGVQREEREKYRKLLQRLKEGCPGNHSTPITGKHCSPRQYPKEALSSSGWGEDRYHGMRTNQFLPKQYRGAETRGPVRAGRNEKRYLKGKIPEPEKSIGQRLENEGRRGQPAESDLSEEVSVRLCLDSGSSSLWRRPSVVEMKDQICPGPEKGKSTEELPKLTVDMEKDISRALGHGPKDEVLSSAFKLRITREDIQTLKNHHWLNDEVINFYMNLLMERNKKQGFPVLFAFSTFFYPKFTSGGYQAVKRWTKAVDLFEQELILVPIHLRVHWSLVVIDLRKKTIRYLDSMGQKGHRVCETLFQYLQEESKTKRNIALDPSEWTLYSMKSHEIPQQLNGSDCGMFVCKYADYLSRDKPITFSQLQMPHFRKRMVWEILYQQLL